MTTKRSERDSGRALKKRVKTARGRKASSTRWLQRQINDPYVAKAKKQGYRSRAAFKLAEIDDRFHFLEPGSKVVDLGSAPGGWSQIAAERIIAGKKNALVAAIDISEMAPIKGVTIINHDFLDEKAPDLIKHVLGGPANAVLCDIAPPATGHAATDHIRIIAMCEAAFYFASEVLAVDGTFVCKVLQGGSEQGLLKEIKRQFKSARHVKPPASRSESAEMYVVAMGFRAIDITGK